MFGVICKFLRQLLQIPPDVQQKQEARAHQGPAGYTPSHPDSKGHRPHGPGEDRWDDAGSALPRHALLQEKGKKTKPHRFRGKPSPQHLKGGFVDSHPLFKGVFPTLGGRGMARRGPRCN